MDATVAAHPREKMKAIVQDGSGSADVLQLREIDRPVVTDDRVLVRVRAASVNALDWHTVHGGRLIRMSCRWRGCLGCIDLELDGSRRM